MKRYLLCLIGYILLFINALQAQSLPVLTTEQKTWLAKANRHEKNGWIYLHIEGTPRQRGFQHGYLLAKEIKESIRISKRTCEYENAVDWSWMVENGAKLFSAKVDSESLAEIEGIVEGMNAAGVSTTRDEMVAFNGTIDLLGYWWPTVKDSIAPNGKIRSKESCSSFIATGSMTTDGKIVLGHNTWSDYYNADYNIMLDIVPAKGHRILMQITPGWIHSGTDFFITDAGLVGSETTISDFFPFDPTGIPEFVRVRRAMQDASSIDEWSDIMKKGNNGGYANSWLIGDIKTNEIARLELGLKYVGYEKTKDGFFTGSNVVEDLRILRRETKTNEVNIKNADVARRVRWKQLMKQYTGKIDVERAKAFLADHYDTYLNTAIPDSRSLCGHWELDREPSGTYEPFRPLGACDGKVVDATMAKNMSCIVRWGSSCGMPFDAVKFLEEHAQYDWMNGILKSRPAQPWTVIKAGEK